MNFKPLSLLLLLLFIFSSCEKDDPVPIDQEESAYKEGLFILNEGNFGSANASVSFLNEENGEIQNHIFQQVNGNPLGDTAQSLSFYEDYAIIVLNVSNKIEIVDRDTFESVATISSNLSNPRYAIVKSGKLYVSNWGDGMNAEDDYIAVFDLSDYSFSEKIEVSEGPEQMLVANNSIYIAHVGGFSFNDIVSVLNSETDEIVKEIEVGDVPNSMVVQGDRLWVLSGGKPSYADEETGGNISEIDLSRNEVLNSFDFAASVHPDHLVDFNGNLFYIIGKSVFKFDNSDALSEMPVLTAEEADILYGFGIKDGKAYIASPNADFTGDGNLYVYDLLNGSILEQYSTGINPNSVYFN